MACQGKPARSAVADRGVSDATLKANPNRAINPFKPNSESNWIMGQTDTSIQEPLNKTSYRADSPPFQSTQNSMRRKAAPPIPKKPTNLTNTTEVLHATTLTIHTSRPSETQAQRMTRKSQHSHQTETPQNAPKHLLSSDSLRSQAGAENGVVSMSIIDRPSLPPRPNVDLLDQEEGEDAKGIPSLKPLRLG